MKMQKISVAAAICLVTGVAWSLHAYAQTYLPNQVSAVQDPARAAPVMARNVVLVHGLWADGSSWGKVVTIRIRCELPTVSDEITAPRAFVQGLA
jgi:hypothetical protein